MSVGEGVWLAIGVVAVAIVLVLFVWAIEWLRDEWSGMVDRWPSDEDAKAEAMVPEFAAAVRVPDYRGGCKCAACHAFPKEPCSDFDGD